MWGQWDDNDNNDNDNNDNDNNDNDNNDNGNYNNNDDNLLLLLLLLAKIISMMFKTSSIVVLEAVPVCPLFAVCSSIVIRRSSFVCSFVHSADCYVP